MKIASNEVLEQTKTLIDDVRSFFEKISFGEKYLPPIASMQEECATPCVLAVAGKVKAGKSYLINALLGVDLAMTGNTETTATINVFKSGKPFSDKKPVLCYWTDGRKEWMPRSFLERLQGTDPSILEITSKIERLVFYIEGNSLLDHVTLVDTPGIGADVGDDGDSHQFQTDTYFKLRKRHESDTRSLSSSADAVIYLFNTVPTETDKSFLSALYNGGQGLSALNGIGVLSKVDKEPEVINNVPKFCKEFEKELFTILPTSAAIDRSLPDIERATFLSRQLKSGFKTEKGFRLAMGSEKAFLHERLPDCSLSVQERKDLLGCLAEPAIPWGAFKVIASELYYSSSITESLNSLQKLSGLNNLREVINKHFFERSLLLRCNRLLTDLKDILIQFTYCDQYINSEYYSQMKPRLLSRCNELEEPYCSLFRQLVIEHIPEKASILNMKSQVEAFQSRAEDIQCSLDAINDLYLAYQKIIQKREEFTSSEFDELYLLFAGKEPELNYMQRQKYWSAIVNSSAPNSIRQYAAKVAKHRYGQLVTSHEKY